MHVARLYLEEAFPTDVPLVRMTFSSLMVTMHRFEEGTLTEGQSSMGLFVTFGEADVANIGGRLAMGTRP